MKMGRKETVISDVKKFFKQAKYQSFNDFISACPFSLDELRSKDRKQDLMQWRQIGMICKAIDLNSLSAAGRFFNKDHATVIHAGRCIKDAIEGFHPVLRSKLNIFFNTTSVNIKEDDLPSSQVIGLVLQERRIKRLLSCTE